MIKLKFPILLFTLFTYSLLAQQPAKISKVIYKKSTYEKKDIEIEDVKMQKIMDEVVAINERIQYALVFNKKQSSYTMEKTLDLDVNSPMYKLAVGSPKIYYKNLETNDHVRYSNSLGKPFNVKIKKNKYQWKITTETKKIGNYLCYKAIGTYEEYNALKDDYSSFNPVVWFTNQIPVPFGPEDFNGLPGLVLEATNNGQTFIYAESIELEKYTDSDYPIKKPKAKEITSQEYSNMFTKRFEN